MTLLKKKKKCKGNINRFYIYIYSEFKQKQKKPTYSSFFFLSPPPLTTLLSKGSRCLFKYSRSFRRTSSWMMPRSRAGLTSPSTCTTSSSGKAPEWIDQNNMKLQFINEILHVLVLHVLPPKLSHYL